MVEREASAEAVQSNVLPGFWLVVSDPKLGPSLRLSHDELGQRLFLTGAEADAQRTQADAQRIRELEAELARRQG